MYACAISCPCFIAQGRTGWLTAHQLNALRVGRFVPRSKPSCDARLKSGLSPTCEFGFLSASARSMQLSAQAQISTQLRSRKTSHSFVQRAAKIRGRMQRLKSKTCRNSSQTITLQAFKRLRKCAESENPNLQQAQNLHLDTPTQSDFDRLLWSVCALNSITGIPAALAA